MSVPRFFKAWYLSVAFFSIIASAACAAEFAGGTGEPNNPYQIASAQQLVSIGSDPNLLDKHYVLVSDIDLDPNLPGGQVFTKAVIAPDINDTSGFQGTAFTGSLNGNGFRIRNLTIHSDTADYLGLFGKIGSEAMVENLYLEGANVTGGADRKYAGVLAAWSQSNINNCFTSGKVCGDEGIGGLVGYNNGQGSIHNCYSTCSVFSRRDYPSQSELGGLVGENRGTITNSRACSDVTGRKHLGGLVGMNGGAYGGKIINCYASGDVTGDSYLGGLVGDNLGKLSNSYANGNIFSEPDYKEPSCVDPRCVNPSFNLGGLVGSNIGTIVKCYSTGSIFEEGEILPFGGLVGSNDNINFFEPVIIGTIINCFWNIETSGILMSDGGMGLTTSQMMDPEVYSLNGWAGDPNWVLDTGNDYPRLAWEEKPGQSIPEPPVIDWFVGYGTQWQPFFIATADQLARIGTASILWDKDFFLISDLDLTGIDLPRIGICRGTGFTGTFDGGNHVVSNLAIDTNSLPISSLGFFGYIGTEGRVSCLDLQDATIEVGSGSEYVGILSGFNHGTIANCSVSGSISSGDYSKYIGGMTGINISTIYGIGTIYGCQVNCSVSGGIGSGYFGGLTGFNKGGSIFGCYASSDMTGHDTIGGLVGRNRSGWFPGIIYACCTDSIVSGQKYLGGLIGYNGSLLYYSFAMGSVIGGDDSSALGGLIGYHEGISFDCYSSTSVSGGNNGRYLGGLVGYKRGGEITNCYAIGSISSGEGSSDLGGLVGLDDSREKDTVMNCFWDIETCGLSESDGGTELGTAELQTAETFLDAGWDFVDETDNGTDDIWKMPPWIGYPLLAWQEIEMPTPGPIAHWAFDEGSGDIATDSAGDNHGTIYNPEWTEGKINGALQFNGFNTYVDCGDSNVLGLEQMTLTLWLEPGHMGGMRYILSRAKESSDDIDYALTRLLTGEVEFTVGQLNTAFVSVLSSSITPLNEWSHVAVSMDGSELSVHINGQLDASANYAERGPRQGHRLVLSSYQGSTRFYFGKLDDVRIYDTALSEDDIEALYTDSSQ